MAQEPLYTQHQSGRRPLTWAAGFFAALMAGVGLWGGAPWYWWVPVGFASLGLGCLLLANPQSGAELTTKSLRFHHGKRDRTVMLSDIVRVERHVWSEGPDEFTLILKNGETLPMPAQCIDRRFAEALGRAGLALVSS